MSEQDLLLVFGIVSVLASPGISRSRAKAQDQDAETERKNRNTGWMIGGFAIVMWAFFRLTPV